MASRNELHEETWRRVSVCVILELVPCSVETYRFKITLPPLQPLLNLTKDFALNCWKFFYFPVNKSTNVPDNYTQGRGSFAVLQHLHDNKICNNHAVLTINQH